MARRSSGAGCGAVIAFGFIAGAVALFKEHPLGVGVAVVAVIALFLAACIPKKCDVCGNLIKQSSSTWQIRGKTKRVCPNCNRRLESRNSKESMDELLRGS